MHGVIFDMDGVLCDSEPFIYEAARRMFVEHYGLDPKREDFKPFIGAGENRFLGGVGEAYGVEMDIPRDKARTYEIYLEIIKGELEPLNGVTDFVAHCRQMGVRLAVATSADRVKMLGNLAELDIDHGTFDALVTGNDVEHKKPSPDIFLIAAGRLGLRPEQCLVVEDAVNGVQAGKAAGSKVLALTTAFPEDALNQAGADHVAPDLSAVPAGVVQWLAS